MGDQEGTRKMAKSASKVVSSVKGGWVKRDAKTGRFIEVGSENGTYRAKPNSEAAVKAASKERQEALRRLANR
jgi:hypothetical protein